MNRSGLTLVLALTVAGAAWSQAPVPKFDAAISAPNGCVDCHKVAGTTDTRLNVLLAAKKHLDVNAIVRSVPDGCIMCHREGVQAGPLSRQTHRIHYTSAPATPFVPPYQKSCLVCHAVDAATGAAKQKIAPKNW